jgi:hypothetical protein
MSRRTGFRIRRIHLHIDHAGRVVHEQRLREGASAVGRLVQAAVRRRLERIAEDAEVGDVRVSPVDVDAGDVLFLEAEQRPRAAAVGRLPEAVTVRRVAADAGLAAPTHTTSGLRASTAIAPIVPPKYLSLIGVQVRPPSVVFITPPPVVPNQYSLGLATDPGHGDRPAAAIRATSRQRNPPNTAESRTIGVVGAGGTRRTGRVGRG